LIFCQQVKLKDVLTSLLALGVGFHQAALFNPIALTARKEIGLLISTAILPGRTTAGTPQLVKGCESWIAALVAEV